MTDFGVLDLLRDFQDRQDPFGEHMTFDEWRVEKQHGRGIPISPGLGMSGHLSNPGRRIGNSYTDRQAYLGNPGRNGPRRSQYLADSRSQPPAWIDDVDMETTWYSPMEPVWPYGPPWANRPREWNFPVGYNLNFIQPRMELIAQLRAMRNSWGVLATLIQTRKNQLLRLPWTLQHKDQPRKKTKGLEEAKKFARRPDGILTYAQWSRKLMDDLFIADCPFIYIDRFPSGKFRGVEVLDGGMIFPLIDDSGRRPQTTYELDAEGIVYLHRQPAYQQIAYGLPMINFSADEIIYPMESPRPDMPMFGYGRVEQIFIETTEAIRKTIYQTEFWRSGSMPELIITVPDNWNPKHIASFQAHFDALLSGNLTLKSKVRFVPGGMKPFDIKNASGESLWSQRDETLIRLACFALDIPPTPFVKQVNRGTAQNAQQTAQEEGLYPLMSWYKDDVWDVVLAEAGYDDIEKVYLPRPEVDLLKQSQIQVNQVHNGIGTINEVREENGKEPIDGGDVPIIILGGGAFPLKDIISGEAMMPGSGQQGGDDKPPKQAPDNRTDVRAKPQHGPAKPHESSPQPSVDKAVTWKDIKDASKDIEVEPPEPRRTIGNYKKGHIRIQGLDITIENPKSSKRGEKDEFGVDRRVKMPAPYGYIRGYIGADGMDMDIYLGKYPEERNVWVIDQDKYTAEDKDKGFDEHKVMFGYKTPKKALKDYLKSHYDGLGHERMAALVRISMPDFKHWLKHGDLKRAISEQDVGTVVLRRGDPELQKFDTVSQSTNYLSSGRRRKKKRKKAKLPSGPQWLSLGH